MDDPVNVVTQGLGQNSLFIVTSAKGVMFWSLFVCLLVNPLNSVQQRIQDDFFSPFLYVVICGS